MGARLLCQTRIDVLHVIVPIHCLQEHFYFFPCFIVGERDWVLGAIAELRRHNSEALRRQGFAHGIQIGGVGDEQRRALFGGLEDLRTGFDGGDFRIGILAVRCGFNHANIVEIPRHGAFRTELAFAE